MAYKPYDIASKESKAFLATVNKEAQKMNAIQSRTAAEKPRPLNYLEQSATHCLYAIGEFIDSAREALARRGKLIPRFASRLGILQWAARSLFIDILATLDPAARERFSLNCQSMTLKCVPRDVGKPPAGFRICGDEELCEIHEAAWRGTCTFCTKTGIEARTCPLKKAFDNTMMLVTTDNKDCWWRAD